MIWSKKKIIFGYFVFMLAGIGIFLLAGGLSTGQRETVPPGRDERLWIAGRLIYKTRCTSCHNRDPDLAGPVGPALREASEELLADRLANGKGAMPPQPNSVKWSKALAEYLKR